jgi:hypothetical protein
VLLAGGADESLLQLPQGVVAAPYRNNGYRVEPLDEGWARVVVDGAPVASRAALPVVRDPGDDELARLAIAVAGDAVTVHEAVGRTLAWVSGNIRYELDRTAPQDAPSVLGRRSAYCTGLARLSVALLAARGVTAREVPGWVADEGPHRWIEVWFPDRGWVFSDPLRHHNFVPATYVPMVAADGDVTVAWRANRLRAAGRREGVPGTVSIRMGGGG